MIQVTRQHGIRLPGSVLALTKGLVLVESVALDLDPEFSFVGEVEGMVVRVGVQAAAEEGWS